MPQENATQQIIRTSDQLGAALRRERRKLGLSQSIVSTRTGLRQATVSSVETGQAASQFGTVCALMAALDLELVLRTRTREPTDSEGGVP